MLATIIIGAVVLAVVVLAARSVYKTRKKGGCGYGCEGCSKTGCASHNQPQ